MNDLGRMDKKIQQAVQEYEFFLSYDKKSSNSPKTITVCTTCGFAYHREPKGYWEKDGRSFEEFSNPFPPVFQRVAKIRKKTRPVLKQRVKRDHVIYEEMYFVDGLDVKEIRKSILESLKSADVQVQERQVKGTALNEYLFTKHNFAYKLTFKTWYSGQWAVALKREVSRRESTQRMDSNKK